MLKGRRVGAKHSQAYPAHGVAWLLGEAGLSPSDVTTVAYNFDGRRYLRAPGQLPTHLRQAASRARAAPRARSFTTVHRR